MKKLVLFLMVIFGCGGVSASPIYDTVITVKLPDGRVLHSPTDYYYAADTGCPADKPFGFWPTFRCEFECEYKPAKCVDCNELEALPIQKGFEKDFDICPNRETVKVGWGTYRSQLKECPQNHIHDKDGNCTAIDGRYSFLNLTEEQCQEIYPYLWMYGYCVRYDQVDWAISKLPRKECKEYHDLIWDEQKKECHKRDYKDDFCLSDFMFSSLEDGDCVSCEEKDLEIKAPWAQCVKCENYFWDDISYVCLPDIDEHNARQEDGKILLDMDDVYEVTVPAKNIYRPGYRKKDSKKKEGKLFRYRYVSCDVDRAVRTSEYYCDECSNREYVDGKCILKKETQK